MQPRPGSSDKPKLAEGIVAVLQALPQDALQQPLIYLSSAQRDVCLRIPALADIAPRLPGWVPHRAVAQALGHGQVATLAHCIAHGCYLTIMAWHPHPPSQAGIDLALSCGAPYVWATEFENVHEFWRYSEPQITVDGVTCVCQCAAVPLLSQRCYRSARPQ
jgi:hypothetical protein